MIILHDRFELRSDRVLGRYSVNGGASIRGFTLEDPPRAVKVPKFTGIPAGRYRVVMRHSPKQGEAVPWLQDVPEFTLIEVHVGNYPTDTDGCVLVGEAIHPLTGDLIRSRRNFGPLRDAIEAAEQRGEPVWWEITESFRQAAPEVM